jgi:hypothetical protein
MVALDPNSARGPEFGPAEVEADALKCLQRLAPCSHEPVDRCRPTIWAPPRKGDRLLWRRVAIEEEIILHLVWTPYRGNFGRKPAVAALVGGASIVAAGYLSWTGRGPSRHPCLTVPPPHTIGRNSASLTWQLALLHGVVIDGGLASEASYVDSADAGIRGWFSTTDCPMADQA